MLEDVLGYDGLSEITREMNLKDKYVDLQTHDDVGFVEILIARGNQVRNELL